MPSLTNSFRMNLILRYFLVFASIFILLVPVLPPEAGTNSKIRLKIAIFSNRADLEAAERLMDLLSEMGYEVSIYGAGVFDLVVGLRKVDVFIIIGGPRAYEGIGEISSLYLSEEVRRRLVKEEGFFGYWITEVLDEALICVVIAGNTRVETKMAEEVYEKRGLDETVLKVSVILKRKLNKDEFDLLKQAGFEAHLYTERNMIGRASLRSISKISELPFVEEIRPIHLSEIKAVLVVLP